MNTNDITLEYLTEENYAKVRLLHREDISEAFVDTVDTLMELTRYGVEHNCVGHTYAVKYGEEYIGAVLLGEAIPWETDPEEMKEQPFYRLMGFVIDKHYRGLGVGAYVLESVIADCYQEFGVRPIALGCHKDNHNAARFYEKHGFRKTEMMEGNDFYYLRYPEGLEKNLIQEIYRLFRKTLPYIVRSKETALRILGNPANTVFEKRNESGRLIGVSVLRENTIYLLCVDKEYRNRGIGTQLLEQSEEAIKSAGYKEVIIGVGEDYLTPGVPTSKRYATTENERLWDGLDETASDFFEHRGYVHSWGESNCFDMMFPLSEFEREEHCIGDTIDGIQYRWAAIEDLPEISACTNEASEDFTRWYQEASMYTGEGCSRVLIATCGDTVAGTLIVDIGIEREGIGSVGCTAVHPGFRGKHIAVNMVTLGTKYLKEVGMREAFLSYTYSGLDHLYGYAGYKICVYYMMARKKLEGEV